MTERSGARPSLLWGAAHLGVLWAFAFQRTLFDLLGGNPEFFVARGNARGDILVWAIAFTFVPPLAMLAIEWVASLVRRGLYEGVHLAFVGLLGTAFFLQLLKGVAAGPAGVLVAVALALGALLAYAYRHTAFTPQALSVLSPVPVLFLAILLLLSPVHKLVLPQHEARAATRIDAYAPVVMLLFDELPTATIMDRRGEIDARRFPNFAKLASHSTWFPNATTVADKTPRAVPAMLTSHNPGYRKLPIASDQPRNLFTLLGGSYEVEATETATRLCPDSVCPRSSRSLPGFGTRLKDLASDLRVVSEHLLLPNALRRHLPPIGQTFGGFGSALGDPGATTPAEVAQSQEDYDAQLRGDRVGPGGKAAMFLDFVERINGEDRRFNFLDVQLPHYPWEYLQTGQAYPAHYPDLDNFIIEDPPGRFIDNQWLVDQSHARHLLQAGAADRLLGAMIRRMKRTGAWEKSVLLVSADHGVSFRGGGFRREVTAENLEDIAFVPLFVRKPGQTRGRRVAAHTCTTDIPRLIAAPLDVRLPWPEDPCKPDEIAVLDSFGETRRGTVASQIARRNATVRRKFERFGDGWRPVYEFGPRPELVGRPVSSFRGSPAPRNLIRLDRASDPSDVHPRGPLVPAMLMGTIAQAAPEEGLPLAVAVNGRVAAVTRAFELPDKTRFGAMVPATAYREGRNSVEVFTISGSARRPRLDSLGGVNLK